MNDTDASNILALGYWVTDHEYWDNGHGQQEHAPYCRCERRWVQRVQKPSRDAKID